MTTHATELKLFAHAVPRVANASVRFDPETFVPTFHLDTGAPGQSLAFPLAQSIGIADEIVERAQRLLDSRERDYESALAELSLRNAELQREREGLENERLAARGERAALQRERGALDAERRAFGEKAEERMQQALRDFVAELTRRAEIRRARAAEGDGVAGRIALLDDCGYPSRSRHSPRGADGDGRWRVSAGRSRARALARAGRNGRRRLRRHAAGGDRRDEDRRSEERRAASRPIGCRQKACAGCKAAAARLEAATRSSAELDVRGKRFVDAEPLVERWIDEAVLAGTRRCA